MGNITVYSLLIPKCCTHQIDWVGTSRYASVAQLAEQGLLNSLVTGSSPVSRTYGDVVELVNTRPVYPADGCTRAGLITVYRFESCYPY